MGYLKKMQVSFSYIHLLILIWIAVIYYGERVYPRNAISNCSWPRNKNWPNDANPTRVALIADPQLIDDHTYPGRNKIFQRVSEFIVDLYLRRNWVYINSQLDPDANLFLGDLFDGGREWENRVWEQEYIRWNKIFTKPPYKRTIMSLPGNHDIGYGNTIVYSSLQRFTTYFGEPSSSIDIGNHTVVLLDTISMLNTDNETIYSKPYTFLNELVQKEGFYDNEQNPRILLTHVPLFRDPMHPCGRYRESKKPLPYVKGYQYQTMATPEVSQIILESVRPSVIFSGDDHDACYVLHNYTLSNSNDKNNQVTHSAAEYTVKSISMAMGIGAPGIQLLSLYNDPTHPKKNTNINEPMANLKINKPGNTFSTTICLMPNPFKAFVFYIMMIIFTVAVLVVFTFAPKLIPTKVHAVLSQRYPLCTITVSKPSRSFFPNISISSSISDVPDHYYQNLSVDTNDNNNLPLLPLHSSDLPNPLKTSSVATSPTSNTTTSRIFSTSSASSSSSIPSSDAQNTSFPTDTTGKTSKHQKQVSFALNDGDENSISPYSSVGSKSRSNSLSNGNTDFSSADYRPNENSASIHQLSFKAMMYRAKRKMSQKSLWKKVFKELALVSVVPCVFFFYLSKAIYMN